MTGGSPFDEIVYRLYVLGKGQQSLKDIDAGRTVSTKDSPTNAKAVVRDILARAATLPETPRIGRQVPELDDPDIREVPAHSWRVI